jgi:hypothetical protein
MRAVTITTLCLSLLTLPVLAASKKPLNATEMQALFKNGLTISVHDMKGGSVYTGTISFKPDGTQTGTITMAGKPPIATGGTWKLKGSKFCRVLPPIVDKEVCEDWVLTGDKQVTVYDHNKAIGINILP